jgi:hypothetical protein
MLIDFQAIFHQFQNFKNQGFVKQGGRLYDQHY